MTLSRLLGAVLLGVVSALAEAAEPIRGDVDRDGNLNITDAINVLGFLFLTNAAPYCQPAADANDDGTVNITDAVQVLNYLFLAGPRLPELSAEEVRDCGGGPNLPPSLLSRPLYHAYPGFLVEFAIGAVDPEGDQLRYEARGMPPGASLDALTGVLRWTPGEDVLGPVDFPYSVTDEAGPPNRVEGRLVFHVYPLDPCNRPRCDPARGCEPSLVDLSEDCCGDPAARVPEPEVACPEGAELHAGRNAQNSPTIGRLQNCDGLRLAVLDQEGFETRLNVEARCLGTRQVAIQARLETAAAVLFDYPLERTLEPRADGFYEARGLRYLAENSFSEGMEALLTVSVRGGDGIELLRKVRVVLTRQRLDDLP